MQGRCHRPLAVYLIACLFFIGACSDTSAPPAAKPPMTTQGTIVAMGNSLTEGLGVAEESAYPALLENKLRAEGYSYRVVNAGVSGETSSGALSRVKWVMNLNPDIVILETGANDGFRGIDPDLIRQNLAAIVKFFKAREVTVILAGMQMVRNMGPDYTQRFAEVYPAVAQQQGALLIPFFLEGVAARPELNQRDGIHPTPAGYRVIVETLYPHVLRAIRSRPAD